MWCKGYYRAIENNSVAHKDIEVNIVCVGFSVGHFFTDNKIGIHSWGLIRIASYSIKNAKYIQGYTKYFGYHTVHEISNISNMKYKN